MEPNATETTERFGPSGELQPPPERVWVCERWYRRHDGWEHVQTVLGLPEMIADYESLGYRCTPYALSESARPAVRRFQINPGPLRVVPSRQRRWGRSTYELAQEVRCQATTRAGTRCERTQANDSDYCWQHR
jgi:hypothetical protein